LRFQLPKWYGILVAVFTRILRLRGSPRVMDWIPQDGLRVWIHGASLGETKAVIQIARHLPRGVQAVLTSTTQSGLDRLRSELPDTLSFLAPWDDPAIATHFALSMGVTKLLLVEAEIWPGWIRAMQRLGVPVAVATVRVGGKSRERWRRLWKLFPGLPHALECVWANAGEVPRARDAGFVNIAQGASLKWAGVTPRREWFVPGRHAGISLHRCDAKELARIAGEWGGGWMLFPRRLRDVGFWRNWAAAQGFTQVGSAKDASDGCAWVADRFGLVKDALPGCEKAWVSPGHDAWEPLFLGAKESWPSGYGQEHLDAYRQRVAKGLEQVELWLKGL
jgi:3-Deoxy-D-manno-octulosonic-acid transferase (kdotransferase)